MAILPDATLEHRQRANRPGYRIGKPKDGPVLRGALHLLAGGEFDIKWPLATYAEQSQIMAAFKQGRTLLEHTITIQGTTIQARFTAPPQARTVSARRWSIDATIDVRAA